MNQTSEALSSIRRLDETSIRFFLTMALLAIQARAYPVALSILNSLIALNVALPVSRLLLAYAYCRANPGHEGRQQLLEVVEQYPGFALARAMLALEDRARGLEGWQGLAESVAGGQGMAAVLAQCVLERPVAPESTQAEGLAMASHFARA
jgi:lipopolysaccharide biosynthesis regulator YciM